MQQPFLCKVQGEYMVFGIGTDIVEISRIKKAIASPGFLQRVFTSEEIAYCSSRGAQSAASYAARFAGKEAFLKAMGTGLRHGCLQDIEILPNELGAPVLKLSGVFKTLAEDRGISEIFISLSHSKEYATAQCLLEKK